VFSLFSKGSPPLTVAGDGEYEKQRFLNGVGEKNDLGFKDYEDVCFWGSYEFGLSVERCRCSLAEVG